MTETREKSKAIIVLGMHRSGTSALTGVLSLLGVDLGGSLEPPTEDNAKGYFENTEAVSAHERLLDALGSSWSDVRPLPNGWAEGEAARPFKAELKDIIIRNFAVANLWGVKDPRMCRLSPIWLPILSETGCEPHFIIMNRHPREVAGSLGKRDGFSEEKSYLLWLSHTLESVKWSEGSRRVFVTYDQLLGDWKTVAEQIASGLGISWPRGLEQVREKIGSFLSPDLKRQRAEQKTAEDLPKMVLRTHLAVEKMSREGENEEARAELAGLYDEMMEGYRMFGALSSMEADLRVEIARLGREINNLTGELSRFREETPKLREAFAFAEKLAYEREDKIKEKQRQMDRLKASFSWRITRPLRETNRIFKRILSGPERGEK